ncbi:MAG: dimethyl sulfoxide reductase anchor subunit [Desulfobulbus sp.]|nr:dimethyl sulfoxide reductase anchor subunit [Desulfobulbus sp.]
MMMTKPAFPAAALSTTVPRHLSARRQNYWDWRAAGNFIGGGTGGSLLFFTAWVAQGSGAFIALALIALAVMAVGLTCVWLEIGRPWRALNVFRHSTSWMTREAAVATLLFAVTLPILFFANAALFWISGLLGLLFVYSQARILTADKGIPAWRHPRCVPLMLSTGLCEGAGLLALLAPWLAPAAGNWLPPLLTGLIVARVLLWREYLDGLRQAGIPRGALDVLQALDRPFVVVGHAVPVALLLVSWLDAAAALRPLLTALAGFCALTAGWAIKYNLVRRASWNQGFALPHQPVRGRKTATMAPTAGRNDAASL